MDQNEPIDSDLAVRIQALPQELQDDILWRTDAFHIPTTTVTINWPGNADIKPPYLKSHYKPPVALQLNQKYRKDFAREYYSSVVFECITNSFFDCRRKHSENVNGFWPHNSWDHRTNGIRHLASWLQNLDVAHQRMIGTLQVYSIVPLPGHAAGGQGAREDARLLKEMLQREVEINTQNLKLILCYDVVRYHRDGTAKKWYFDVHGKRLEEMERH